MAKASLKSFSAEEMAEFFTYLDALRVSGETNMFGARPYLVDEFSMDEDVAGLVLTAWMKTFGQTSALERATTAIAA